MTKKPTETQKRIEQHSSTWSLKSVTIGQLADSAELVKKFWPLLLGIGAAVVYLAHYIAPNSAVIKLSCVAEHRIAEIKSNASITLLGNQKTNYIRQQTNLRELQTILLKAQLSNLDSGLDLTVLEAGLDALVDKAAFRESKLSDEIKAAEKTADIIEQRVKSCGRSGL